MSGLVGDWRTVDGVLVLHVEGRPIASVRSGAGGWWTISPATLATATHDTALDAQTHVEDSLRRYAARITAALATTPPTGRADGEG